MNFLITLFIIFFSVNTFSSEVDTALSCRQSFFKNKTFSTLVSSLSIDDGTFITMDVIEYCKCEAPNIIKENNEKKENWLKYAFKDKSKMLISKDICSAKSFTHPRSLEVFYITKFTNWFSSSIDEKISKHVMGASIRKIAGEDKWYEYLSCAHKIIEERCSKIKSLSVTYSCIKDSFNPVEYDKKINRQCDLYLHDKPKKMQLVEFSGMML